MDSFLLNADAEYLPKPISVGNLMFAQQLAFNIHRANPKVSLVILPELPQLEKMEESIQSH